MNYIQPNFNREGFHPHRSRRRLIVFSLILLVAIGGALYLARELSFREITVANTTSAHGTLWNAITQALPFAKDIGDDPEYVMPKNDPKRTDILILGIRGKDDPDGGSLSDTMILLSFDPESGKAALVSIPRDFYVRIDTTRNDRINTAYERLGLKGTRTLVSRITGIFIDNIVVFDFNAFQKIVDAVDGITITLDKPFKETTQWGYTFELPVGENHLDGQAALYYVRSRYSTSDFDRARRQQQVIFAIKEKLQSLNLLTDPVRALELIAATRGNIVTDVDVFDINSLLTLARNLSPATIRRHVLSTENFLYQTHINGAYVLLPQGDTLDPLKDFFKNVLK